MKKLILFAFSMILLIACEPSRPLKDCSTYEELPDPKPVGAGWENVNSGFNACFGSIDVRYAKHEVPPMKEKLIYWEDTAWKGERASAQLVFWTTVPAEQVEIQVTDLKSGKNKITSEAIHTHFVRYVMTDEFANGCGYRKPENFDSSLSADVLDHVECMNMEANSVRPVWISIDVPRTAEAGLYKGNLIVYAKANGKSVEKKFNLNLEVLDRTLPPVAEWTFHLDLWQHPAAVARYHQVPVWSDQHFEYMRSVMKRLADAGQKVITATLNKDPWNGQCYDRYADMITWTRKADGTWKYDYSVFDRWVQFMMDLGVTKQINCYSMVPWNNELDYFDEATGEKVTVQAIPGKPVFEELWTPFIADFKSHLKSKSWLEKTNIAMDERDPVTMKATIGFLQKQAPELGIALSDNHKSYKEYPFLKEISTSYGSAIEPEDLTYRKDNGLNTIYYVCCSHKFPNAFTFSPPAEAAYNIYFAEAAGFDGFSRWAYNSWVENPLQDSRFRTWPAGDTYYVYPENRGSIRMERLLEGMQNVEKLRIIRHELSQVGTLISDAKLKKIEKMLAGFNVFPKPETPVEQLVNDARRLINELSR